MNPPVPFPSYDRRPSDFEWPYPTLADRLKRYFAFLLAATKIKGVDLAPDHQRGQIESVQAMRDAGYLFAFVQVNRGLWVHPNLMEFCAPLLDAGFPIMTYALFYGTLRGEDQANFHLEHAYPIWQAQGKKLPAMLDVELRDGVTIATRVTRSQDWFRTVRPEVDPVLYCSPSLNRELLGDAPLGDVIGHVAHWTSALEPTIPGGWTREKTRFWQYGVATKYPWCPPVPGMTSDVDVDYFFGTFPELLALDRGVPYYSASASPSPSLPPAEVDISRVIIARDLLSQFIEDHRSQPLPPSASPSPSPAPQPLDVWTMTVKAEQRAKTWSYIVWNDEQGRLVEKWNNAEPRRPIMQEYFDTNGNRLTFPNGEQIDTYKTLTDADGPISYYKLYNRTGDRGQPLYVAQPDMMKPY